MTTEIENVLLYISDSVRFDIGSEIFSEFCGSSIKTAAHSTYTFTSIPSMLIGLTPKRHGIRSAKHEGGVAAEDTIFGLGDYNRYLKANRVMARLFGGDDVEVEPHFEESSRLNMETVEAPFIYVEQDMGGHAPYGNGKEYDSGLAFLQDTANESADQLETYYRRSVQRSADKLAGMFETLKDRGLYDSTLIIVTSDHGEHLHDYGGLTGHLHPATPELVYVPTFVLHPNVEQDTLPGFIQHVDIVPTILEALDESTPIAKEGQSLFSSDYDPRPAPNLTQLFPQKLERFGDICIYHQESVWDEGGGHVFNRLGPVQRGIFTTIDMLIERKAMGGKWRGLHPASLREYIGYYLREHTEFGNPVTDAEVAREILETQNEVEGQIRALDERTEQQLKELGYI